MSSRARARTWPYPRQRYFEQRMRKVAAKWFASRGLRTHARYPYILAQYGDWADNIILPEVAEGIGLNANPLVKASHFIGTSITA